MQKNGRESGVLNIYIRSKKASVPLKQQQEANKESHQANNEEFEKKREKQAIRDGEKSKSYLRDTCI